MSEVPVCPYCGANVPVDFSRVGYDEKIVIQCRNCGGQFEYMPGFGAFSLPGEGHRTQSQVRTEGSYSGSSYDDEDAWQLDRPASQQSGCGTCCAICVCLIILFTMFPLFLLFGGFGQIFG